MTEGERHAPIAESGALAGPDPLLRRGWIWNVLYASYWVQDSFIRRLVNWRVSPYRRKVRVLPGHGREGLDHVVAVERSGRAWGWVASCLLSDPTDYDEAGTDWGDTPVDHVHAVSQRFRKRRAAVRWALDHLDRAGAL